MIGQLIKQLLVLKKEASLIIVHVVVLRRMLQLFQRLLIIGQAGVLLNRLQLKKREKKDGLVEPVI